MPSDKALLVIDMQNDLCQDPRRRRLIDAMLPSLQSAIVQCQEALVPVIFTQYWLEAGAEQFRRFGDTYCLANTVGAEIIDELRDFVGDDNLVKKTKHSAFFGTDLDVRLARLGTRTLGLAGLQTHICIMTTAADANFRGIRPVALSDCVVSSDSLKKDQALAWIADYVGSVATANEFLSEVSDDGVLSR